ncbi:TrmH family RNA methyltransferase [Peijinzhouia sedimentorum]
MISKNLLKLANSLQLKKYRTQEQSFLIEGGKSVQELLNSHFKITHLFVTDVFAQQFEKQISENPAELHLCNEKDLEKIGTFKTNNAAVAIAKIPANEKFEIKNEWVLALDDIRDPGNLGTIIRIADWYGITKILCSSNTVDVYNPKVINSSMGSFLRVKLFYTDLAVYLNQLNIPILGAFLDGENAHKINYPNAGVLVIGNESEGISREVAKFISQKVNIPRFGGAESLNAGIATAVLLDNIVKSNTQ